MPLLEPPRAGRFEMPPERPRLIKHALRQGPAVLRLAEAFLRGAYGLLIRLSDLAAFSVQLDAVAVEGDVTAGDHDARAPARYCVEQEGGEGMRPSRTAEKLHPRSPADRDHDGSGAGAGPRQ